MRVGTSAPRHAGIAGVLGMTVGVRTLLAPLPEAPILLAW